MYELSDGTLPDRAPADAETIDAPIDDAMASPATAPEVGDTDTGSSLWAGDRGRLAEQSRRALLELIQGPYLSGARKPRLWGALLTDTDAIRSRLHELFLELVIDTVDEFAFVRPVRTDELAVPVAVRTATLTFMDTLMLLVLRQMLLAAHGEQRVIVGRDEVYEQLQAYRSSRDEADYEKRMNASWVKLMNKLGLIHKAGADDRVEISPVVKFIVDADRVTALTAEYRAAAQRGSAAGRGETLDEALDETLDETALDADDTEDDDTESGTTA